MQGAAFRGLQGTADEGEQLLIGFAGGKLRMILLNLLGGAEQESGFAGLDHAEIVVAVAGGDGLKAADVNGDGNVNVADIAMIASHIKGIKALS